MKFADALAESTKRPGFPCSLGKVMFELKPDDAAELAAALANEKVQASTISRALQLLWEKDLVSHKVAANTVSRHRRGDCRCG